MEFSLSLSAMASLCNPASAINGEFSEKAFFLKAFQGIHLAFVISQDSDLTSQTLPVLQRVLQDLTGQYTSNGHMGRPILLFQDVPAVAKKLEPLFASLSAVLLHLQLEDAFFCTKTGPRRVPPALWQPRPARPLLIAARVTATTIQQFAEKIVAVSLVLRMSRLVWIDSGGAMIDANGRTVAFSNNARLTDIIRKEKLLAEPRWHLLKRFEALLTGGVKAISLCRLADLEQELFTYQGCGSFFSQQPYCRVHRLGLDDFERAANIIRKGEQEGFLLARSTEAVAEVLAGSYGAFILDGQLAGLCALQTADYQPEQAGEIVSLYTLTRFQGTGVGMQLLRYLVRDAKRLGLHSLFACTQHERVAEFFLRPRFNHHRERFQRVEPVLIPAAKWRGYDPERKKRVICLRLQLATVDLEHHPPKGESLS